MSDEQNLSPAGETIQPPAEVAATRTESERIAALEAKNRDVILEKQRVSEKADAKIAELERQLNQLRNAHQKKERERLVNGQEFEKLWNEAQVQNGEIVAENQSLKDEIARLNTVAKDQQIKSAVVNAYGQGGVHSPEHLFSLMQNSLKLNEQGQVVSLHGGVETSLETHVQQLKASGSGFDYFFAGSGARGSGASGSVPASPSGKSLSQMNFTERLTLEVEQPELYARLKAQEGS